MTRIRSLDLARFQQKVIPWAMKGGLALLDQGIFSGSNFVISILLARWMSAEQYGMYADAFAVFLFLLNFHQALLLEPMLVFGSSAYRRCLHGYMKVLVLLHLGMTFVMALGLCISAVIVSKVGQGSGLSGALLGVAFATPTVLLLWLIRRAFYLKLSPAPSVRAALIYCVLTMGGLALVYRYHYLSAFSAFLLMGFGGLGASIVLLQYLMSELSSNETTPPLLDIWRRHWRYGRWALGANALMWIPINAFYPILSKLSGMTQAGELKALMNLASPMLQACAALHMLLLPYSARVFEARGPEGINLVLKRMTLLCAGCAIPYWMMVLAFQRSAFRVLYSGRYTDVAYLLPVVALASVAGSAFYGPCIALRSIEAPNSIFAAVLISSCIAVAVGIPLTWAWGVSGAVWGIALSESLAFVTALMLARRKCRFALQTEPALAALSTNE